MKNSDKAKEICGRGCQYRSKDCEKGCMTFNNVMAMAQWKDKQLGWHDAKKEQPPMDEEVIVLTSVLMDAKNLDAPRKICFGHIVDKEICVDYDGWNIPRVVYWMYFPKLK